ncbi:hypothetical protein JHK87_042359 [Glycine soja]|nr:hypothetical protein JHK87_042359 [Glycine soja]
MCYEDTEFRTKWEAVRFFSIGRSQKPEPLNNMQPGPPQLFPTGHRRHFRAFFFSTSMLTTAFSTPKTHVCSGCEMRYPNFCKNLTVKYLSCLCYILVITYLACN